MIIHIACSEARFLGTSQVLGAYYSADVCANIDTLSISLVSSLVRVRRGIRRRNYILRVTQNMEANDIYFQIAYNIRKVIKRLTI